MQYWAYVPADPLSLDTVARAHAQSPGNTLEYSRRRCWIVLWQGTRAVKQRDSPPRRRRWSFACFPQFDGVRSLGRRQEGIR